MTPEYSIVIACYNSSKWLSDLVAEVEAAMADCRGNFELVLVNDASPDGKAWPVIAKLAADRPWIRGLDLQFNVGQFMALMAGLDVAEGAYIITMDDDLQHSPADLPKLIRAMGEIPDTDVVIGRFPSINTRSPTTINCLPSSSRIDRPPVSIRCSACRTP